MIRKTALAFAIFVCASTVVGTGPAQAQTFTSCSQAHQVCAARCNTSDNASCVREVCAPKLKSCRASGCWQEAPRFGGGQTCNLKKS